MLRTDCFFIQHGKIVIEVESEHGRKMALGILGEGEFFGIGSLADRPVRMSSATAMTDCVLLHIEKGVMMLTMNREPKLSAIIIQSLLRRNIRYQQDLVDQRCSPSEMRLARILLLLARSDKQCVLPYMAVVPKPGQTTLAELVGTTRSRVSFFLTKFRKAGVINYGKGDDLNVHRSLLRIVRNGGGGSVMPSNAKPKGRRKQDRDLARQTAVKVDQQTETLTP